MRAALLPARQDSQDGDARSRRTIVAAGVIRNRVSCRDVYTTRTLCRERSVLVLLNSSTPFWRMHALLVNTRRSQTYAVARCRRFGVRRYSQPIYFFLSTIFSQSGSKDHVRASVLLLICRGETRKGSKINTSCVVQILYFFSAGELHLQ